MTAHERMVRRRQRRDAARARARAEEAVARSTEWLDEMTEPPNYDEVERIAHWADPELWKPRVVRLWAVNATVAIKSGEWTSARQVPMFFLDPNVQGIRSERHATNIARDVLETAGATVSYIHVVPVYEGE